MGNIDPSINEQSIAGVIYPFGQYTSIRIARASNCAFVEYIDRNNAEYAASNMYNALMINGKPISVGWAKGKSSVQAPTNNSTDGLYLQSYVSSQNRVLPPPPGMAHVPPQYYALPNLPLPNAIYTSSTNQFVSKKPRLEK